MSSRRQSIIRVRHYTRVSAKAKILRELRLVPKDQHRVFVEKADREALSPRKAESTYLLKRGKGNAYVEFEVQTVELKSQTNRLTGETEWFLRGEVDLSNRHPEGFDNRKART